MKTIKDWMIVAIGMMAIFLVAKIAVTSGNKFNVVYFQGNTIEGYQAKTDSVDVFASTHLKYKEVSGFKTFLGWVFWLGIGFVCWYTGNDMHQRKRKASDTAYGTGQGKAILMLIATTVLCGVFWFAKFSSTLDHDKWQSSFADFKTKFQITDATEAKIKEKGGSGTLYIKDENGLLTDYFKGK